MAGKFALIIGNSRYEDSSLGRLKAPDVDVQGLASVLKASEVGHFDEVTTLLNEGCASVRKAVARFYDQRQRDDLLLLYFSGHGVRDEQGHLYLALRDTESRLLAGTAIETAFIAGRMDRSFSKRQVLVLDCCHSGAFAHGSKAAQGVSVGTAEALEGTGLGRVVLTATDATQYAWEGDQIIGDAQNSLFTHFLIEGLKTGAADRDEDGVVTVDELYDYVHEQVVNTTPRQTPNKWTYRHQGEIVLAQNPFAKRSTLPPEIEEAITSTLLSLRLEAVRNLETLLRGHHVGRARAALAALKDLSLDDSRKVANAAVEALKDCDEEERRQRIQPHLAAARAAIERKQFVQALESLRRVAKLDAQAEGLAELVRIAEEGQADFQGMLAERALTRNLPDAAAPVTPALPLDLDGTGAHRVRIPEAVAAETARRNAESPATADDHVKGHAEAQASDIFISYAREDRDKARALANVLTARGWKVWWDRKIAPGEAFDEVIERELGTCRCAIVLWSARSVNATWVRNEARRAARRKVLVPILLDPVETPLEFENLQAADLTSWKAAADHPEFEAVFDRIQALLPIPHERLARSAVEDARREFGAGRRQAALKSLEQFRPAHDLVTRALAELRAEADRVEREQEEASRREAWQRQRELGTAAAQIEDLLGHLELDAAERALSIAEKKFEYPALWRPHRERLDTLRAEQCDQLARKAVEDARGEFGAGRRQAALKSLEQFRPAHDLVTRALAELRAEADHIELERAKAAREAESAQRQRELGSATARIEELLGRPDSDAAERALATTETKFEYPAECGPLRERLETLRGQVQREQLARKAVEDARGEFGAGRREAALAGLEQFRPAHDLVTRALTELRAEADHIELERAKAAREAESAQRQRELGSATARIEELLGRPVERGELDVAEPAPATAETSFEPPAQLHPWYTSRPVLIAVAGLLALIVGTWLAGVWPGRSPRGPRDLRQPPTQVTERPTPVPAPPPIARGKSVENASVESLTESPAPETPPIEIVAPTPDPPTVVTVDPRKSGESPAGKQASPSGRVEQLRTQARASRQSGQREKALNAVAQGLQIVPRDPVLRTMRDSMLTEARDSAARSKEDALALDADERAGKVFGQGQEKERAAEKLRRTGKLEDATRSFWMAEDRFRAAAEESRRIAEEDAAAETLIKKRASEQVPAQPPQAPIQPEKKPVPAPTEVENVAAANQALRQYEIAYATMKVEAVRGVYPSAPIDELERDFAGASSCTVKIDLDTNFKFVGGQSFAGLASAPGRMTKTIVKKSGAMPPVVRSVTIQLARQGNTWIITQIR